MNIVKELRKVASSQDIAGVKRVLKNNPELVEDWKCLLDACYQGRSEIVEVLLQHGANPNVVSKTAHRHRPLHRVIEHKKTRPTHDGHLKCVKILLERGADPLARGTFQQVTPLQLAAMGDETQYLSALKPVMKRLDIFHHCVLGDHQSVARILKRDIDKAIADDANGWKPMMYVAASRLRRRPTRWLRVRKF